MDLSQPDDPRVGSGRDNSTGGTLSHFQAGSDSSSLSALGSTFVPVLIYSVVCLVIFLFLRTRCPRVYAPRTIPGILLPEELSPQLPSGWFNWIKPFFQTPDTFLLLHGSLDGFFFLRYIKVLAIICLVGCCCTWPILLPLHGTGDRGLTQLDLLTIGNVTSSSTLYGHLVASWVFFGFILYMISRECIYYVNLRQAYLLSPSHAQRLSSRTVMFTCVPRNLLDEARIRKLFGDAVKNVWIPRNTGGLQKLVEEREQTAARLEKAEIALIKMANAARAKQASGVAHETIPPTELEQGRDHRSKEKSSGEAQLSERSRASSEPSLDLLGGQKDAVKTETNDSDYVHPYGLSPSLPDVRGSVAAQWIPVEARPSHRPLANFGRRVDTIRWTRSRLKALNIQIYKMRRMLRAGQGKPINALFVEFDSQANAETAYQIVAHHRPLHMSPAFIGIRPHDVVWSTLRMEWWERIARRFMVMGFIAVAVIFWSFPSAFVALISKVSSLASIPLLAWITKLPKPILGLIEGLLPAIALSLLMAAVPGMLRACARGAGVPSVPLVESFVQNAYFVFQVVQVFLITTLTAAASNALLEIIQSPIAAKDLLSANIPKASNFYLSYILVQCLAGGASELVHILPLIQHQIMAKGVENPRWLFRVHNRLQRKHWGSVFPVFTNLAVIAICYSCIAPLILGFAGFGMCIIYAVYRYNLMYCFESDIDTKGLLYPRALTQLIVGLYLAQICLVGLFALHSGFIPMILMVLFLVFTVLVHLSLNDAVSPLLYNLPRTLALHDKDLSDEVDEVTTTGDAGLSGPRSHETGTGAASDYYNLEEGMEGLDTDQHAGETNTRAVEGASGLASAVKEWIVGRTKDKLELEAEAGGLSNFLGKLNWWLTPNKDKKPNFFVKWLHPEIYEDYHVVCQIFPTDVPPLEYPEEFQRRGYWPPEMWMPNPKLWIPRDDAHVSRQEVAHTRDIVPITDQGAWLNEKGKVEIDINAAPFKEPRVRF